MANAFRLLGPLEADADGRLVDLGAPKQRALLAALLVQRGEVVPRSSLIDSLWGEDAPASAAASLQVYVHGLRRALGAERIETRGNGYRINVEPQELDLDQFERLLERGSRALQSGSPAAAAEDLRGALALRRGVPLADLAEQPVARVAAPYLEERCLEALELKNDAELALGRHEALLPELEQLIAEHPYRERLREQQILALYRSGRQKDALDAYRAARATLLEELGVDPAPVLQELERAVLRHDPSLAAPARAVPGTVRLPRPPTALVGRRLELAAVTALIRREDVRLVTLTGPGGTGKTRLALAAAAELAPELEGGAVFVDLAPVSEPGLVPSSIAQALNVPQEHETLADAIAQLVGDRSILLLIDNFEQVLDSAPVLSTLIAAAPRLRVLVTSRGPLRLSGEQEYPVPPLPVPPLGPSTFEEVAANDAVRLFTTRAQAVDPAFTLTESNLAYVATICRRLDGLPLAIELASARTRLLAPEQIAERLEQALELLTEGARDLPPRQQTLRATLDWSYRLLPDQAQALLARLSVFAGGLTLDAAGEVVGTDGDLLSLLGSLVDSNLLRRVDARHGLPRFAMLETIRAYGFDRLGARGEEVEYGRRHAEHFLAVAEAAAPNFIGGDFTDTLELLDDEHDNLRAALVWAMDTGELEMQTRLAISLRWYWIIRGYLREGSGFFERIVADTAGADPSLRAAALAHGAALFYRLGDLATAEAWWKESLELYRLLDDADGISRCVAELGGVAMATGDLDAAVDTYLESCRLFEQLGNETRLGIALANLGAIESLRRNFDASISYAERALALQRKTGDRDGAAVTLQNLARTRLTIGDTATANELLRECLDLGGQLGYREVIAYALGTAAELAFATGDHERAGRLLGASEALFAAIGVEMQGEEREGFDRTTSSLRDLLGDVRTDELLDAGRDTSVEDAIREAAR